jgi:hypothetical protein
VIVTYNKHRYSIIARERCVNGMCTLVEVDTTVPRTKVVPCRNIDWLEPAAVTDNKLGLQPSGA